MKAIVGILPWAVVVAAIGGGIWWLLSRDMSAGRWLLAALLIGHGVVHVMFAVPAPAATAGGPDWPFDMARSWAITGAGLDLNTVRAVGVALIANVVGGFALAALSTVGSWCRPAGGRRPLWCRPSRRRSCWSCSSSPSCCSASRSIPSSSRWWQPGRGCPDRRGNGVGEHDTTPTLGERSRSRRRIAAEAAVQAWLARPATDPVAWKTPVCLGWTAESCPTDGTRHRSLTSRSPMPAASIGPASNRSSPLASDTR